jgi:hypothetical protein
MLDIDALHTPDPYVPLPENARRAALDNISKQGFTPLEDYNIFSRRENQPVKTNILAFAHPIHRTLEYTGLTVFNATNGHNDVSLVSLLARSAAPFHLIHRNGEFSFWTSPVLDKQPNPHLIESHISYDQLDSALSEYEVDLKPQRIINVKQGIGTFSIFRDIEPLQLSLWASEVTNKQLVKHFAATVESLRNSINTRTNLTEEEKDAIVTKLSIQLLGAIILADTGVLNEEMRLKRPSLSMLIQRASSKFGRYFKYDFFTRYASEAEQAYQLLQQICYAGFMPDMLSDLYKAAYSKEERKESGSYNTPLYLTRRIWKNIPVEYLPPQKRTVADMTCGWGSFLIAGHERLSSLKDMNGIVLRDQIYGNDNASFTAQLAGLGLLLSTSEDSWDIDSKEALQWQWLNTHQPSIIVGNPPFSGSRERLAEKPSLSEQKTREERANRFLEHAINRLAPHGYLAMLMPSSFVASEASPQYRRHLLEHCDLLELWDIPSGIFDAEVRTNVIFAQKKGHPLEHTRHPVRVRTIQPKTLKHTDSLIYTASGLVTDQSLWNEESKKSKGSQNTYIMDLKVILPEYAWHTIQTFCENLRDYAIIIRGAIVGKKPENKRWTDYQYPKQVPWLEGVKDIMPPSHPFFIDYTQVRKIIYPNELEEPRKSKNLSKDKESILADIKVLVPYNTDATWGKRVRVAIERKKYYVSDHFYAVVPKSLAQKKHITHEVLAAVLDWDVSNAWIVEHLKTAHIPKRVIDTIPFPNDLSEQDCNALTQAVLQLEAAAYSNQPEPTEARKVIDSVLKKAYHLDETTFARLRRVKEWNTTSQITLDLQPNSDEPNCFISGIVDSVNAIQGTITLWVKGFDELQTVQIVPSMPGWMLRPEAAFRTEIPYGYVKCGIIDPTTTSWGIFRPQPFTYLSEEELFEGFANLLLENSRIG